MKNQIVIDINREIAEVYQPYFLAEWQKVLYIFKHGRGTTTSSFLAADNIFRLLNTPHVDTMGILFNEDEIEAKIYQDYMQAFERFKIPKILYEGVCPKKGDKYILIRNKWGVNKIWFEHAKKKSEGFKGWNPSPGNKWLSLRLYELTSFEGWNGWEIENLISTFARNAYGGIDIDKCEQYCLDNNIKFIKDDKWIQEQDWYVADWKKFLKKGFVVQAEYNTPQPGSKGVWVEEWEKSVINDPDTEFVFNNYLYLTPSERLRFLGAQNLNKIENLKLISLPQYENIYLGKPGSNSMITFPNLSEKNFGFFKDIRPDLITIGVDVGRVDATVFTASLFQTAPNKDLKIQLGEEYWYHSNGRQEFWINDEKQPFEVYDIVRYVKSLIDFIKKVHAKYPLSIIHLQMDEAGIGASYYEYLWNILGEEKIIQNSVLPNWPMWLKIHAKWTKELPEKRIDTLNLSFGAPEVCKIKCKKLFNAYKNQVYDERRYKENKEKVRLDDPRILIYDMDSQDANEYSILSPLHILIKDRLLKNLGKKLY